MLDYTPFRQTYRLPLSIEWASFGEALSTGAGRGVVEITRIMPPESIRLKLLALTFTGTDNERGI